jgi:Zn-dependent peptidase ImmA (M78 family)
MYARRTAAKLIKTHWDWQLPVNPVAIAKAMDVTVQRDPKLGSACGCFDFRDGAPTIRINPDNSALLQRFTVAHQLGHYALLHGRRYINTFEFGKQFVDTKKEFSASEIGFYEKQANIFALELLMPGVAINLLIMRRNMCATSELSDAFWVTESMMRWKLKRWLRAQQ